MAKLYDVTSRTDPTAVLIIHNPMPMEEEEALKLVKEVEKWGYNNIKLRQVIEKEDD